MLQARIDFGNVSRMFSAVSRVGVPPWNRWSGMVKRTPAGLQPVAWQFERWTKWVRCGNRINWRGYLLCWERRQICIDAVGISTASIPVKQVWEMKSTSKKEPFLKRFSLLASDFCIIDYLRVAWAEWKLGKSYWKGGPMLVNWKVLADKNEYSRNYDCQCRPMQMLSQNWGKCLAKQLI